MKLYVFGCSYSDFLPLNQTTWGHELARNLNCELVHEGRGAGSNWRMWRRCMHYLLQGEISQQDLVIIQYTGVERREFWSSHCAESSTDQQRLDTTGIINRERAYDGNLIRFKAYSWSWQDSIYEKRLMKLYEERFVNPDYDNELFSAQHHMFQTALKYHHIRAVFIDGRHTPPGLLDLIDPYDRWQFREPQSLQEDVSTWYHSTDCSHFCDQGHKQLADLLTQHLRNQQLIS